MDISQEMPEETERRLLGVMATANIEWLEPTFAFEEVRGLPAAGDLEKSLACVRDRNTWCCLVPSADPSRELFAVARVSFESGGDNSGFIGWLATRLKSALGTGVFVICGSNEARGGIFDYWGFPARIRDEARLMIQSLITRAPRHPERGGPANT